MSIKPWKFIESRTNDPYPIFTLRTDRAVSPRTHREHDFYVLDSPDWVNVIPITEENDIILIRQYRHGIREVTLEIPGGIVEPGDSPLETARRELIEETGYRASQMIPLGLVHPNPAILNNRCHTFLALHLSPTGHQQQDEKEDIEVVITPVREVPRLIREGRISHALIISAFYRYYMEYLPSLESKIS
jgi:8-oxo-dGTP pyrophosphatase MutT (NUDIX family)